MEAQILIELLECLRLFNANAKPTEEQRSKAEQARDRLAHWLEPVGPTIAEGLFVGFLDCGFYLAFDETGVLQCEITEHIEDAYGSTANHVN